MVLYSYHTQSTVRKKMATDIYLNNNNDNNNNNNNNFIRAVCFFILFLCNCIYLSQFTSWSMAYKKKQFKDKHCFQYQSSYLSFVNSLFYFCCTDLTWGKWAYKKH